MTRGSFKIACDIVGLRACAGDRYQKFRCGAPGARCPGGSHRRPSAVACSPPREGSAWSTPNASQVSLKRRKASQTFDKLRIGRKKRACTAFLAVCQKLYAFYMLLHFFKNQNDFEKMLMKQWNRNEICEDKISKTEWHTIFATLNLAMRKKWCLRHSLTHTRRSISSIRRAQKNAI